MARAACRSAASRDGPTMRPSSSSASSGGRTSSSSSRVPGSSVIRRRLVTRTAQPLPGSRARTWAASAASSRKTSIGRSASKER